MNTKYLDFKNNINFDELKSASKILKNNGLVIFPTDTVYGIGANGLDASAVSKIFDIKKRDINKPLVLLINDKNMLPLICNNISELEYKLMDAFWPGAFTIILNTPNSKIPNNVTANLNSIGVRIPNNKIAQKLIEYSGMPLATPSANISGKASGITVEQIKKDFDGKVELVIDGGKSELCVASTIVKVINNIPHILRQGTITPEQIKQVAGNVIID